MTLPPNEPDSPSHADPHHRITPATNAPGKIDSDHSSDSVRGQLIPVGNGLPLYHREDLYCLLCGYNLRGLSGDPVRCPECGERNDLADLRVPATLITRKLRKLETTPTMSIAILMAAGAMGVVSGTGWIALDVRYWLGLIGLWAITIARFGAICGWERGWMRAMTLFQVAGTCVVTGYSSCALFIWLAAQIAMVWLGAITGIVSTMLLLHLGLRIYDRAKKSVVDLQRHTAVALARRELRRRYRRTRAKRAMDANP